MGREVFRVAGRCAVMLTVSGLVAGAVFLLAAEPGLTLVRDPSDGYDQLARMSFDTALAALCSLALVGCAAWLVVVSCLVTVEALAGVTSASGKASVVLAATSRVSPRVAPVALRRLVLRRLVLGGCGVALATSVTGAPALADHADPVAATPRSTLVGLAVPDRAVGTRAAAVSHTDVTAVRVSSGDCLWSLAERALPRGSDPAEVAAAWRRIHRANLYLIGPDPDLILPGTPLQIPDLDPSHRKDSL